MFGGLGFQGLGVEGLIDYVPIKKYGKQRSCKRRQGLSEMGR